jgi:uncharacterized repeat protein (TIGR03803 family)
LTTLYSFTGFYDGQVPLAGLIQGSDGNFYGTTSVAGGLPPDFSGSGTVFEISSGGSLTTLYCFTNGIDGANPFAGLVEDGRGNFYGTAVNGGTSGNGTVFSISGIHPANFAFVTLHSFTGDDGAFPSAGLAQGSNGNFYGTTTGGGTNGGQGTVFEIGTNGTLTSLYSFAGGANGGGPDAALVEGSDGNFYGTTSGVNSNGNGIIFKMSPSGSVTNLYSFTGGTDGAGPSGLVEGSDGNFYGTTVFGGTGSGNIEGHYGYGTVFKITPGGSLTTLYSFSGGDGALPSGLVRGSDSNFYGTAATGGLVTDGSGDAYDGDGTVFKISASGSFTTLYLFTNGIDGSSPGGLVEGSDGNFYGTTTYDRGTVFRISPGGSLTTLYYFAGGSDGAEPEAALVRGSDGNFYGTTVSGGITNNNVFGQDGYGTVFQISPSGSFTSLYSFTGGEDGGKPSGLVKGNDGNFYGTTIFGGTPTTVAEEAEGTVFRISMGLTSGTTEFTIFVTASTTNGVAPLNVNFTSSSNDGNGNTIVGWNWNFGDGATSTNQNPSHVYNNAGTFQPSLVATYNLGVTVYGSGPSIIVSPPIVTFTASPTNGAARSTVQFTCPNIDSGGSTISSWNWAFGDGAASTAQSPSHVYASDGTYYPTLIATNSLGETVYGWGADVPFTVNTPVCAYENLVYSMGPIAYYRFDEPTGNTAYDFFGGHNGTYESAAIRGDPGVPDPPFFGFETNNLSVGISNLTANSWVLAPFGTLGVTNVTFTAWIYPVGVQNAWAGIIYDRTGDVGGVSYYGSSGMIGYTWGLNNAGTYNWASELIPPSNQWSFVAVTISPTQAVVYVCNTNATNSATNPIPHTAVTTGNNWHIGNDAKADPGRTFNGLIDEVAIFPYSLTPTQVSQLYDAAITAPQVTLAVTRSGQNVVITWPSGTLQSAPAVTGPWTSLGSNSPYSLVPIGTHQYFRVKLQ